MAMEENPYAAPKATGQVVGVRTGRFEDLRKVAVAQKAILYCLLGLILLFVGQMVAPPEARAILGGVYILVSLTATVFVFILAIRVYSTALGVVLGLLALMPCVNLIVLLMINGKATKVLQANGYKVGLLGADMSQFAA